MPFFSIRCGVLWQEKSEKNFNGGGSCAHKDNIGMYGV